MLITLLALVLIIIGGWLITKEGDTEYLGAVIFITGCIVMFGCLISIMGNHIAATRQMNKNKIQYESLQKRLEIVNSEYEDVSKSDVIKDIANWNQEAYNYKYWNSNLFTNWMYSDKVAESYKYIEY
jgi:archaellum component FlaF (FlaF/FlaG flagellin family)